MSQPTGGTVVVHFVAQSPGHAIVAQLASVGIPAVNIGDGDAGNPLGSPLLLQMIMVDHPPDSFVVSISFHSLVLGARSGQGFRSLFSPRGYGDSSTAFENQIIDRFFEVAIAVASVGRFYTVVQLVNSLLWSFTLATRVCLLHDNSVFVVDKYGILTNATWVQPPACAGRFRIEDFASVCVERSGTLLQSLCAEPRRTRAGRPHRQSSLDCLGTLRRGERLQSVNEVRENVEVTSYGGPRNPHAAVAVRSREVMEELVYDPEFHAPRLAALDTLCSA